jgi:hypothetical protein
MLTIARESDGSTTYEFNENLVKKDSGDVDTILVPKLARSGSKKQSFDEWLEENDDTVEDVIGAVMNTLEGLCMDGYTLEVAANHVRRDTMMYLYNTFDHS